jgi:hypothetical protein
MKRMNCVHAHADSRNMAVEHLQSKNGKQVKEREGFLSRLNRLLHSITLRPGFVRCFLRSAVTFTVKYIRIFIYCFAPVAGEFLL